MGPGRGVLAEDADALEQPAGALCGRGVAALDRSQHCRIHWRHSLAGAMPALPSIAWSQRSGHGKTMSQKGVSRER
jgi:hypothetical protein